MATTAGTFRHRLESTKLTKFQVAISFGLLALCCVPSKHFRWDVYHQTIWRKTHLLLTITILVAFGFILPSLHDYAWPYYACAVALVLVEVVQSGCRHTLRDASITDPEDGDCIIEAPSSSSSCNFGVFYYYLGQPLPASWSHCGKNMIILPKDVKTLKDLKTGEKTIEIEGPYGPSLGPLWWMYYCLRQGSKLIIKSNWKADQRRPPQLISTHILAFVVDDTAVARAFPLWLWVKLNHSRISFGISELKEQQPSTFTSAYQKFKKESFKEDTKVSPSFHTIGSQSGMMVSLEDAERVLELGTGSGRQVSDLLQELKLKAFDPGIQLGNVRQSGYVAGKDFSFLVTCIS